MAEQYYMVVDEKTVGPFSLEEIKLHQRLTPETLVWKPGIDNWIPAREMPEFDMLFRSSSRFAGNDNFNNPVNGYPQGDSFQGGGYGPGHQESPYQDQGAYNQGGYNSNQGLYNQGPGSYNGQGIYNPNQGGYPGNQRSSMRTNWLPWAIVATVVGFFTSCIGVIFGIIGIVQANKANTFYAQGMDREGDNANSNAKTMTIIGLVLAGLGLIVLIFYFAAIGAAISSF